MFNSQNSQTMSFTEEQFHKFIDICSYAVMEMNDEEIYDIFDINGEDPTIEEIEEFRETCREIWETPITRFRVKLQD